MIFRIANGVMAALFAFAAAVNFNDPDPVRWVAIYAAACAVAIAVTLNGAAPLLAPLVVGLIALAWAVVWARRVRGLDVFTHMFDAWEMKSVAVEEARETCGLLIVAVWMAAVALHTWSGAR